MAQRSAIASFSNQTGATLTLASAVIQHGEWDQQPPQTIAAQSTASWSSESDGFATGTAAQVVYSLPGGQVVTTYDNPFSGDNGATGQAPPTFQLATDYSQGDNMTVTYTLTGGA